MPGDYMRLTFDPCDDHAGVLMQQGRVLLDADWNELVELLDRRWRAETMDVIGRCVVPRETPDGFRIDASGGSLTIGRGRAYVHGMLAENHGSGPLEYDPTLGERRGTLPTPYGQQPYLPNPPALPGGGPHLVYLDIWQREKTAVEDPDLVEKAVGVDTATRLQTVWQVRVLENVGQNVTCATPDDQVPGWLDVIRPSAGRLSTAAIGIPADDDPCFIPPNAGYRGAENRLYRVEVHEGGSLGTATFKWSRDNASVATAVTELNAARDRLTVVQTGRDAVLRFSPDDWVEVTDDWRELAGQAGELRKVQSVDDVAGTITLTVALPAGAFDPADATRHTRVRRWDQRGLVRDPLNNVVADVDANDGAIPVPLTGPAVQIVLEDGVQVTFEVDPVGGELHVGDYWIFAARTVDASVEILQQAPPRGILHHYCRLALVTFPDVETDCRALWPPECGGEGCDCTVCVTPESHNGGTLTIQQAIDQVAPVGGKVCLQPGIYLLGEQPIRIDGARAVRLVGKGWTTVLVHFGAGPAVVVQGSLGVTVEELSIVTLRSGENQLDRGVGLALRNSVGVTIQRCNVLQIGQGDRAGPAIALAGLLVETFIRENLLVASVGIGVLSSRGDILAGTLTHVTDAPNQYLLAANLYVDDNVLACGRRGVNLDGLSLHLGDTHLAGNTVNGCREAGIVVLGLVARQVWGGSRLNVARNTLRVEGVGIAVGTGDTRVIENDLGPTAPGQGGDGIMLTRGLDRTGVDRVQVLNNRIVGVAGHGITIAAPMRSAMIENNMVQAVGGGGIFMVDESASQSLTVANNHLLNVALLAGQGARPVVAGIRLVRVREAEVANNTVNGVGELAVQARTRAGILAVACASVRVAGNQVAEIGPPGEFVGDAAGIEIIAPFDRVDVADNVVRRSRQLGAQSLPARWYGLRIRGTRQVDGNLVGLVPSAAGVFTIPSATSGFSAFVLSALGFLGIFGHVLVQLPRGREIVAARGNLLETSGPTPAVLVVIEGAITLSDNRCVQTRPDAGGFVPAVFMAGGAIIASSNYVEGTVEGVAVTLVAPNGPFTVLGNITSARIDVNGASLGIPWAPLNVIAP